MQFSTEAISFIEHNLHPDLNSMVPSVLINCRNFVVALYDVSNSASFRRSSMEDRSVNSHDKKYLLLVLYSLDSYHKRPGFSPRGRGLGTRLLVLWTWRIIHLYRTKQQRRFAWISLRTCHNVFAECSQKKQEFTMFPIKKERRQATKVKSSHSNVSVE